jgi:hypothetical protein
VILDGRLYYDDLFKPGCAHIVVRFFNSERPTPRRVTFYTNGVCSPGGLRQDPVYSQVNGSPTNLTQRVGRVEIELFTSETSTGPKTSVGFKVLTH